MKVEKRVKIIIGIVGILAAGLIGFRMLKVESPDVEETQPVVAVESENRRITMSPFVEHTPETVTSTQPDTTNVETPEIEAPPVPEVVPSAESSDAEIREFQAWLSILLTEEDTLEETEQEDSNAEEAEIQSTTI